MRNWLIAICVVCGGIASFYFGSDLTETKTQVNTKAPSLDQVSDIELKRAYRRLINQHHPDKLIAKGMPPEMLQVAKQKTQAISAAYKIIRSSR